MRVKDVPIEGREESFYKMAVNEYESNSGYQNYVNRYAAKHDISPAEALRHKMVLLAYAQYGNPKSKNFDENIIKMVSTGNFKNC